VKPSRVRDRPCAYAGCEVLVLRASRYCRHHLGVLHGAASARTYSCSAECQRQHARCARCRCLCNGGHAWRLRDGLCYQPGMACCWSGLHAYQADDQAELWTLSCLLCGQTSEWRAIPSGRLRCAQCGSGLLWAERRPVTHSRAVKSRGTGR
jgi:hypothetical protein